MFTRFTRPWCLQEWGGGGTRTAHHQRQKRNGICDESSHNGKARGRHVRIMLSKKRGKMNLWCGLIIVPLIGFVWRKIFIQSSTNTTIAVSEDGLFPKDEGFDSSQIWVQNEEISSRELDVVSLSEHEILSDSSLGPQEGIPSQNNCFELDDANANTCSVVSSSSKSDVVHFATSKDLICQHPTPEASLIAEDSLKNFVYGPEEGNESSSNEFGVADYKTVSKTVRNLIESISEPAKLVQKAEIKDDVLSKRRCFINLERCRYDLVWSVAKNFGMRKSNSDWDVMWIDVEAGTKSKQIFIEKCLKMKEHQLISHFPGFWSLSSKDLFIRNLQRMQKCFPGDYNVFPKSWILPRDALQLSVYARNHKWAFFIAKPADSCAGHGIFVTRDVRLDGTRKMIYQLYVRPFLIDGYKFDFRVYVLVTSCDPLRIYVHNEGLARFATVKYEDPTKHNCGNVFMHLTNSCVNARNPSFVKDEFRGHSRRMSGIFKWFQDNRVDSEKIQQSMDDAIIKTMIAVLPTLRHNYHIHFPVDIHSDKCFELMGFDIMLDCELNVHVLEVNPSPSFGPVTHTSYEAEVKESVVRDTFEMLQGNSVNKLGNRRQNASKRGKRRKREVSEPAQALAEWENSHVGNFRKVYPPKPSLEKYYQKFIDKDISLQYNLT